MQHLASSSHFRAAECIDQIPLAEAFPLLTGKMAPSFATLRSISSLLLPSSVGCGGVVWWPSATVALDPLLLVTFFFRFVFGPRARRPCQRLRSCRRSDASSGRKRSWRGKTSIALIALTPANRKHSERGLQIQNNLATMDLLRVPNSTKLIWQLYRRHTIRLLLRRIRVRKVVARSAGRPIQTGDRTL